MTTSINRRTAMLALASTGAIASASAAALVDVNAAEAAAWDSALREYNEAKAACAAFSPVWDRTYESWLPNRPSLDMIDWREFAFKDRDHVARVLDLDKEWARYLDGYGKWWFALDPEPCKARFRAALDSIVAFRKAEAQHNANSGMDAANERSERLTDEFCAAEDVLLAMPAPHGTALLWKLDCLFGPDSRDAKGYGAGWSPGRLDSILADAQRLFKREG